MLLAARIDRFHERIIIIQGLTQPTAVKANPPESLPGQFADAIRHVRFMRIEPCKGDEPLRMGAGQLKDVLIVNFAVLVGLTSHDDGAADAARIHLLYE